MKVLALAAALAAFISPPLYAGWERLRDFAPYTAGPGSALAAGRCDYENGVEYPPPTNLVWLLHGQCDVNPYNCFERWHKDPGPLGLWDYRQGLPWEGHPYVDWGGALAYAPDPFAYPANGRIFAFTGHDTPLFWSYSPVAGEWVQEPDMLDGLEVSEGAALCYGGIWESDGIPCVILYAFVGGESHRFFRYTHPLSPTRGAQRLSGWTGDEGPISVDNYSHCRRKSDVL
jgi:hypothetical protein